MARSSRLAIAKPVLFAEFSDAPQKIYSHAQLRSLLVQRRHAWDLATSTTSRDFLSFLTKHGDLRAHKFRSTAYRREIVRYSWGQVSPLQLAVSLKLRGYLCHGTAMHFHNLGKLSQHTIYVN